MEMTALTTMAMINTTGGDKTLWLLFWFNVSKAGINEAQRKMTRNRKMRLARKMDLMLLNMAGKNLSLQTEY